jgi:hypothetical protein
LIRDRSVNVSEPAQALPDGAQELALLGRFLRRKAPWALLVAVVVGALTFALVASRPRVFEAAALLTLGAADRPASQFSPPILSADGYLRLLNSKPVVSQTRARLEREEVGLGTPGSELEIEATILASRRGELGNTSMIELTAQAPSGEAAAAIANTWAEVFIATELKEVQRAALREATWFLQQEVVRVGDKLRRERDRLAERQKQLASTQPLFSLSSRLTEAQWLAESARAEPGKALGTIVGQQPNPAYNQLLGELRASEVEIAALGPQHAELQASLGLARQLLRRLEEDPQDAWRDLRQKIDENPTLTLPIVGTVQVVNPAFAPRHPQPRWAAAKASLAFLGAFGLCLLGLALTDMIRGASLPPRAD